MDEEQLSQLKTWITETVSEGEFELLFSDFIKSGRIPKDQAKFIRFCENLTKPPENLLESKISSLSVFEEFFTHFFPILNKKIFTRFFKFIPLCKRTTFLKRSFDIFDPKDQNLLIDIVPDDDSSYVFLAQLLFNENTFFHSFTRLLQSYSILKPEIKQYVEKSFRFSLFKGICKEKFKEMVQIAFTTIGYGFDALDMFFTTLTDDSMILVQYCRTDIVDNIFDGIQAVEKLPVSFLRFLIFSSASYSFSESSILFYVQTAPFLLFTYLEHQEFENSVKVWQFLLQETLKIEYWNLKLASKVNIYFAFLQFAISRPKYICLLEESKAIKTIPSYLWDNREKILQNPLLMQFMTIFLAFTRISEIIAQEFTNSFQTSVFFNYFFLNTNQSFINSMLWILSPSTDIPFESVVFLEDVPVLSFFPYPVYMFVSAILPAFLRPLVQTANFQVLEKLLSIMDKQPKSLFRSIAENDMLLPLIAKIDENPVVFEFVSNVLAISCPFESFSTLFSSICTDLAKTTDFLLTLAKKYPLVDDYLHVNAQTALSCPVLNGSMCMWIRPLKSESNLLSIQSGKSISLKIYHDHQFIYIMNNTKVQKIEIDNSIENWTFICIQCLSDCLIVYVNLMKVPYQISLSQKITIIIGDNSSCFDLQSFKVIRPALSNQQVVHLFTLGPNFKDYYVGDFMSFKCPQPSFVVGHEYCSKLYSKWSTALDKYSPGKLSFNYELTIMPPFISKLSTRRSASARERFDRSTEMITHRFFFISFINAFDTHGGLPFLIHITAEIILHHRELHKKIFELWDCLLNRFPMIHQYFIKQPVYCMIGNLLRLPNLDGEILSLSSITKIKNKYMLTNSNIIKHFILGPSIEMNEFSSIFRKLNESIDNQFDSKGNSLNPYAEHNKNVLLKADAFNKIVQAISKTVNKSTNFLELLVVLSFNLTDKDTAQENGNFVFRHLVINHLQFSTSSEPKSDNATVALIHLLHRIMNSFPTISFQIELVLPSLYLICPDAQVALIELLIDHFKEDMLYIFGVVISGLEAPKSVGEQIYAFTIHNIIHSSDIPFHAISIALIYFLSHHEMIEYLFACSTTAINVLKNMEAIPAIAYEHVLMMIHQIESNSTTETSSLLVPQVITQTTPSFSTTTSPLCHFVAYFLFRSYEVGDFTNFKKFFVSIFAMTSIPEYRLSAVSIFLLGRVLETLRENQYVVKNQKFYLFCISFGSFVFNRIHLIPGNKSEALSTILLFFLKEMLYQIDKHDSYEVQNKAIDMMIDFSQLNTISHLIVPEANKCTNFSRHKRFNEMIDRLNNPTSYVPVKAQRQDFENQLETLSQQFSQQDTLNELGLLTIACNAVHYQSNPANDLDIVEETADNIIETWHMIFDSLMNASSKIYESCPTKYRISDTTTLPELRRLLYPINPSTDRLYKSYYKVKYQTELPKIRLKISDVIESASTTLFKAGDVKFSGDAVRLTGISIQRGLIVLTAKTMKFYQNADIDLICFDINGLRSIRLIQFQHQPRGLIVENINHNCYVFAFQSQGLRDSFAETLKSIRPEVLTTEIDQEELQKSAQMWVDGKLSNFDYLLKLNFISGRTWADFTQFPIFPWTCVDFKSDIFDSEDTKHYRDLKYPFFAQNDKQKQQCEMYYSATSEIDPFPHYFPNYVSNVGSALYFLVRLEPFTDEEIGFQSGTLDAADRTFQSFSITLESMTVPGSKSTLELVPEAYFMPEMLENSNNIVFRKSPLNNRNISSVALPPWAKSTHHFVKKMQRAIESNIVSAELNEWIDLIWGVRREGPNAMERYNVFQQIIFQFDPDKYSHDRLLMKAVVDQIHNCGQAPQALFTSFHPLKKHRITKYKNVSITFESQRRRNDIEWFVLPIGVKLRWNKSNSSIEMKKGETSFTLVCFTEIIKPTNISVSGNEFVTSHPLPMINHWRVTPKGVKHLNLLRGHLSKITYVYLNQVCSIIAAGHKDGKVSIFCTNPHRFLRVIDLEDNLAISNIGMFQSNSDLIVFQHTEKRTTIISLYSINGSLKKKIEIDYRISDWATTSFAQGTQKNLLIVLTKDFKLLAFSEFSLKKMCEVTIENRDVSEISIYHNTVLMLFCKKGTTSFWRINYI